MLRHERADGAHLQFGMRKALHGREKVVARDADRQRVWQQAGRARRHKDALDALLGSVDKLRQVGRRRRAGVGRAAKDAPRKAERGGDGDRLRRKGRGELLQVVARRLLPTTLRLALLVHHARAHRVAAHAGCRQLKGLER